ncbi:DUF2066 domain-containing protein [Methylolobus aquaticus]|nr:DUF2066 domain-containing protein [Methylolobus aquaticus]
MGTPIPLRATPRPLPTIVLFYRFLTPHGALLMPRLTSVALILLSVVRVCEAEESPALYVETVTVGARDDKARAGDIRRALSQILERVIAPEDLHGKAGESVLGQSAAYVDQYEYHSGEPGAAGTLEVRFDREQVDEALAHAGFGILGDERPELLVWLRIMDGATARFIGAEDGGALMSALQKAAAKHRVPVILPLLDLTDQTNLTSADIDTVNLPRIRDAIWRYETEVALIGTLVPSGDFEWESRWRFVGPGQAAEWTQGAMGSEEALAGAVDGAFGRLVRLYAPAGRTGATLEIRVEGIGSMTEGEACGRYLRGLPAVRSAEWASADASAVSWRVQVGGSAQAFHQLLAESRRLRPAAEPGSAGAKVYRWVP